MKKKGLIIIIIFSWLFLIGAAGTQMVPDSESPPQSILFNDSLFLARTIPFIIALGIAAGISQARESKKQGEAIVGDKVIRHDSGTTIAHWMNAVGFMLGMLTGGMILSLVDTSVDLRLILITHYLAASLSLFAVFNHITRHGITGGTGLIPKKLSDVWEALGEAVEYTGLFGSEGAVLRIKLPKAIRNSVGRYVKALMNYQPSKVGKYLAAEKILSYPAWAVLTTSIIVTGIIKAIRTVYAIPNSIVALATTVHDITALLISLMLVFHLLPLLLVPANWPLLMSIFRKTVPKDYVEERHPVWYKELVDKQKGSNVVEKSTAD